MRAVVVGAGAVGARAARQLHASSGLEDLVVVDRNLGQARSVATALGEPAQAVAWSESLLEGADVLVLAMPEGHRRFAETALERRVHVVSVSDAVPEVQGLLALDSEARERALTIVVGAGFSPGLSCLLARHAAAWLERVEEVHVAKAGTGGPACARQHHVALAGEVVDWRGVWVHRRGGSGRELNWFPDPVGAQDCYRAALPDALLLVPAFPGVARVTARVSATRRDRLTAGLPMLRPPHPEGMVGAVRAEVRGRVGGTSETRVLGVLDRPAVAAGAVAALAALWAAEGRFVRPGAAGLAELVPSSIPFLTELAQRGVKAAIFEGALVGA